MTDSQFLWQMEKDGKLRWTLFGSTGYWTIEGTSLALSYEERFVEESNCGWAETAWRLKTARYFIILKTYPFCKPLAEIWPEVDWEFLESEAARVNEDFSHTPDC